MNNRPTSFTTLVEAIAKFPSIGPKSATRIALWLLRRPPEVSNEIAVAITKARATIRSCQTCHQLAEEIECPVCADGSRDRTKICVVEDTVDAWSIEETGDFAGLYHVLGGVLSPLDGIGIDELNIESLIARVKSSDNQVEEIILATDFDTEGNATSSYIAECFENTSIKITRLAYGLPAGGELSHSSHATLTHALAGRREL